MAEPGSTTPARRYRFADLTLDLGRRRLSREGEPITLSKLTFELLRVLVEQAPNVVAHGDLASKTWGGRRVVTPECLAKRVMLLRQALGDQADNPRYIERIRGQGYRLIPQVLEVTSTAAPDERHAEAVVPQAGADDAPAAVVDPPAPVVLRSSPKESAARPMFRFPRDGRSSRWAAFGAAALVLALAGWMSGGQPGRQDAAGKVLAVLPFENRSVAEEDAGFFAEGLHDDLITRLAAIGDVKIVPRATMMEYRGWPGGRRRVGEDLDADVVLDGSVQRAGDMVRVNVQLVDTRTDETLWGESYDEELTAGNVFAIQRQIVTTLAQELKAKLTPEEETRLGEAPTQNMRALDLYLSGRDYERPPFAYWGTAAHQYERAVEEDPEFALAHARLSIANLLAFYNIDWDRSRIRTAKRAAEEALRLQPDLPIARVAMAYYLLSVGEDPERAAQELAIAEPDMQGEPQFFLVRALLNERRGKREAAMADRSAALALSPRDPVLMLDLAQWHARVREHDEAARLVERALDFRPDFRAAEMLEAELALLRDGDPGPVRALSMEDYAEDPGRLGRLRHLQWLGALYERDYGSAVRILNELETAYERAAASDAGASSDSPAGADPAAGSRDESAPASLPYLAAMAGTLLAAGDIDAARELCLNGLERIEEGPEWRVWRAAFLAGSGDAKKAVRLAREVLREGPADSPFTNDLRLWVLFDVLAPAGASGAAVEVLDQYLSRPGNWSIEGLLGDPRLDSIRKDPRFEGLVAKHRRRDAVRFAERTAR